MDRPEDWAEVAKKSKSNIQAAVTMRLYGATYQEIAEQCEYTTPAAARIAVEQAIAAAGAGGQVDTASARNMAEMRFEQVLRSLAHNATHDKIAVPHPRDHTKEIMVNNPEHLPYVREWMKIMDRMIALRGLNAPTQIQLESPGAQELQSFVNRWKEIEAGAVIAEGDIWDAEEVDDEDEDGEQRAEG